MLTVETAHTLFDGLTPQACASIQTIIFGSKSFDRPTSAIAAAKIQLMTSLVHADLADTIAGRETSIGLDVLKTFGASLMNAAHLESLDLSFNALGTRGINVLQPIIQKHNLKTLRFFDTGLAAGACEEVLRCLELCAETHGTLGMEELVFGESTSNSEGAIAIGKMLLLAEQNIQIFQMSAIRCGTSQYMSDPLLGGHAIAESLLNCRNLRHLNISDNSFRGAHEKIARAVANMPHLTILNVKDIILTDEGVDACLQALSSRQPPLEELYIGHNNLSPVGLKRLRSVTRAVSSTLHVLSLRGAEDLENVGAVMVGKALEGVCNGLVELDMSECFLTRRGALVMITKALPGKTQFTKLGLDGNRISEMGLEEMEMMLGGFFFFWDGVVWCTLGF